MTGFLSWFIFVLQMHNCFRQMTWNKWNKSHLRPKRENHIINIKWKLLKLVKYVELLLGNLRKSGTHNPESAILILSYATAFSKIKLFLA